VSHDRELSAVAKVKPRLHSWELRELLSSLAGPWMICTGRQGDERCRAVELDSRFGSASVAEKREAKRQAGSTCMGARFIGAEVQLAGLDGAAGQSHGLLPVPSFDRQP
jgi:hypothetical protein